MKRIGFAAAAILATFLVIEVGTRVIFALRVGPSVLLYGTPFERLGAPKLLSDADASNERAELDRKHTVMVHRNEQRGYSKYYPNQERVDYDPQSGEIFEVTINDRGFRGVDFNTRKAPGVVRVVSLGASSTFGYYSRDEQTYPALLELELDTRCRDHQDYEVINLGIPHLDSTHIAALFQSEGAILEPDIVTFYEGVNDTNAIVRRLARDRAASRDAFTRWAAAKARFMGDHLVTVGFVRSLLEGRPIPFSELDLKAVTRLASTRLLGNLDRIRRTSEGADALLLVATQQATSTTLDPAALRESSYAGEVAMVRRRAGEAGRARSAEIRLIAHSELMRELIAWAEQNGVTWVDGIAALDDDRSVLLSWVHLSPEGNLRLAKSFAEPILKATCTKVATSSPEETEHE